MNEDLVKMVRKFETILNLIKKEKLILVFSIQPIGLISVMYRRKAEYESIPYEPSYLGRINRIAVEKLNLF